MGKAQIDLRSDETVLKEAKGDYWKKTLISSKQIRGKYHFTNQRIIFTSSSLVGSGEIFEIEYKDITEVKKGMINFFIPTGINVIMKDGTKHLLSLLGRNKWIELINKQIKVMRTYINS